MRLERKREISFQQKKLHLLDLKDFSWGMGYDTFLRDCFFFFFFARDFFVIVKSQCSKNFHEWVDLIESLSSSKAIQR
jgi:hypothetical protein